MVTVPLTALARRSALLLWLILLSLPLLAPSAISGDGGITLVTAKATSRFPEGILFEVEATSDSEITSITVRLNIGRRTIGTYDYLEFEKGTSVDGELFYRTNTAARYIPPGALITYHFEIEDSGGQRLETEPETLVLTDARFEWQDVTGGPVTVSYHGPVKTRAETVRDAILETLDHMGPLLGADTSEPIRVTMYNNVREMLDALPPRSATIGRELITQGQAHAEEGVLLVLGGDPLTKGTASHEVTHILVHRATDNPFGTIPAWLNEGLAEYGNIDPGFSYDLALQFAIATDRLLPIIFLTTPPGTPEDIIIFYGEARSIVAFLVDRFGVEGMAEFLDAFKSGKSIDKALQEVYGFDRRGLDRQWRDSIGAPPYISPDEGGARPTPAPLPTLLPYSLTPQPQGQSLVTPTPEPAEVPTPTPVPTPLSQATQAPELTAARETGGGGGFACSVPSAHGGRVALDFSTVTFLVGLVGLGLAARRRR